MYQQATRRLDARQGLPVDLRPPRQGTSAASPGPAWCDPHWPLRWRLFRLVPQTLVWRLEKVETGVRFGR